MNSINRVVIIGAGGHAREVADIVRSQARHLGGPILLGCIVDSPNLSATHQDLPILGDWSWFDGADRADVGVICAVGNPTDRKRLALRATSLGLRFAKAVSPQAYIAESALLGEGAMIFPGAVISTHVYFGDHAIANSGSTIGHDGHIQDFVTISPGVHIAGNVSVGEGCYFGIGSSVIPRLSIGAWTIVGAGATVIQNVPDAVTVVGVPARPITTKQHLL
jgi:sugar O-acyltransferase (sialic acid O-acetyltransferase NeuD family)